MAVVVTTAFLACHQEGFCGHHHVQSMSSQILIWQEGVIRLISSEPNCIIPSPTGIGVDPFESVHMFLSRGSFEP